MLALFAGCLLPTACHDGLGADDRIFACVGDEDCAAGYTCQPSQHPELATRTVCLPCACRADLAEATDPAPYRLGAAPDSAICAYYACDIDASTVTERTFTVHGSMTGFYPSDVSLDRSRAVLQPQAAFKPGERLTAFAAARTTSVEGDALLHGRMWTFRARAGRATGTFTDPVQAAAIPAMLEAADLAVGDLNGDGKLDALVAATARGSTVVSGCLALFGGAGAVPIEGCDAGRGVALGDWDGDSDLDGVVTYEGGLCVLRNDEGTLRTVRTLRDSQLGGRAEMGDLDGDGDLDVVVATSRVADSVVTVWLGDGRGRFVRAHHGLGDADAEGLAVEDLDQDGDLDVVLAVAGGQANQIWLNDGDARFHLGRELRHEGGAQLLNDDRDVDVGDLNGDGSPDLFFTTKGPDVVWLWSTTAQQFVQGDLLGDSQGTAATLGDLDGDGDLDVYVANASSDEVLLNDGAGHFDSIAQAFPNLATFQAALGDADGDGDLDAMVVGDGADLDGQVTLWANADPFVVSRVWPAANSPAAPVEPGPDALGFELSVALDGLPNQDGVSVVGALSGKHDVQLALREDGRRVDLVGATFFPGELVTVSVTPDWSDGRGSRLQPMIWQFRTEARGTRTVFTRETLLEGVFINDVVLGDLDRDGDVDAVLVSDRSTDASANEPDWVLLNNGDGTFAPDQRQQLPPPEAGSRSCRVALAFLDDDDLPDLLISGWFAEDCVRFNQGAPGSNVFSGECASRLSLGAVTPNAGDATSGCLAPSAGPARQDVALGDLDADGDTDALFLMTKSAQLWLNDGTGALAYDASIELSGTYAPSLARAVALGDADLDGDLDAWFGVDSGSNLVWMNDGGRLYDSGQTLGSESTFGIAVAELTASEPDGTHRLDLFGGNHGSNYLWEAHPGAPICASGREGGTFESSRTSGGDPTRDVAVADLDGDGVLDAVVANATEPSMMAAFRDLFWYGGDGLGASNPTTETVASNVGVAVADVDGDGDLDVFLVGSLGASLWRNGAR